MITVPHDGALLVIRQTDHGDQTGLFASAWGNEDVEAVRDHKHSIELAATHHDDGWAVWERRPTIDPNHGRPVQFLELSPHEHIPLYRAGIERAVQHDLRTGLLISMHGVGLYNSRYSTFSLIDRTYSPDEQILVDEFLKDMYELQLQLSHQLTSHPGSATKNEHGDSHIIENPEVRYEYLLLQVWDRLSLQFGYRLAVDGEISPLPISKQEPTKLVCKNNGAFRLKLNPYPFVENNMTFPLEAVRIADRVYKTPEDFLEEVAGKTPTVLECHTSRFP